METAPLPQDEENRLLDLYSYDLLDSATEKEYDDLVELAGRICNCPISLITLVDKDRQWFKAKKGLTDSETSRSVAFCAHTILGKDIMMVENALEDKRFHDNPLVTGEMNIRFYAGFPVVSPSGQPLGSLCVINTIPSTLNSFQHRALEILSGQVTKLLELRARNKMQRKRAEELLAKKDETISSLLQHDGSAEALKDDVKQQLAQKMLACNLYLYRAEEDNDNRLQLLQRCRELIGEILADYRMISGTKDGETGNVPSYPVEQMLAGFVEESRPHVNYTISFSATGNVDETNIEGNLVCLRIIEKWMQILAQNSTVTELCVSIEINTGFHLVLADNGNGKELGISESGNISDLESQVRKYGGVVTCSRTADAKNQLEINIPLLSPHFV